MLSEHRIDCAVDTLFYEVCGAVAALVFFENAVGSRYKMES